MIKKIRQIFDILNSCEIPKKSIVIVFIFSIITIFFELLGIGVFIPLIEIISNNNNEVNLFEKIINLQFYDKKNLYVFLALGLIIIMAIKSFVLIINSYLLTKFWSLVNERVTLKVFSSILNLSHPEFTKKSNSSFSNIIVEAEKFTELTKYTIIFFVEWSVLFSLFILLFSYDFKSSLVIFFFLMICINSIYFLFKDKTTLWGSERQKILE